MSLVRWSPAHSMMRSRNPWGSFMDDFFRSWDDDEVVNQVWSPRVDITEDENDYRLVADLPGMSHKDVEITVEDGVLTLKGEREMKNEKKNESVHVSERAYGKFVRSFNLRGAVDAEKIEANFKNGELTVRLPKREAAKPRKIEIKAS